LRHNACPELFAAVTIAIELAQLWETATLRVATFHPSAEVRLEALLRKGDLELGSFDNVATFQFARALSRRVERLAAAVNRTPRGYFSPWLRLGNECLEIEDAMERSRHFRSRAMTFLAVGNVTRLGKRDWLGEQSGGGASIARSVRKLAAP
jgi:hypothetical protein